MTQPIASGPLASGTIEPRPWLTLEPPPREIQPLTGDISPRRYFRVVLADGATAILANYPEEVRPACERFLRTTAILDGAGVRVPRVLAGDCGAGWMLVEDLGLRTLGEWGRGRPWSELAGYFEHALETAERIARLPVDGLAELNPVLAADLRAALDALCAALGGEPPVPCHRDFMVRNLMPLPDGGLAVLDHQDLRLGPPLYDLASLLNDTLFPPPEAEEALLAAAAGSRSGRVRYHRAAAQRTLKAVGTYAKFARLGAERHLPLIGPTLAHFVKHLSRIPEGSAIAARLREAWSPVWATPGRL